MHLSKPDGTPPDSSDIVLPGGGGYRKVNVQITMNYAPKSDRYGNQIYTQSTTEFLNVTITSSGYMTVPLVIDSNAASAYLQVRRSYDSIIKILHQSINLPIDSLIKIINHLN